MENLIDISNHPSIQDIKRKALVRSYFTDYENEKIILNLLIKHYDINDNLIPGMPNVFKTLVASGKKVDETGEFIQEGELGYEDALTEWELIMQNYADVNTANMQVVEYFTILRDNGNVFNVSIYPEKV